MERWGERQRRGGDIEKKRDKGDNEKKLSKSGKIQVGS